MVHSDIRMVCSGIRKVYSDVRAVHADIRTLHSDIRILRTVFRFISSCPRCMPSFVLKPAFAAPEAGFCVCGSSFPALPGATQRVIGISFSIAPAHHYHQQHSLVLLSAARHDVMFCVAL